MAFQFSKAPFFKPGMLFFGRDDAGFAVGIETERHAITIAGAGSGKGAALIIPNLLRWLHSCVVIDPKGENAEQTWKARQSIGQLVGVIDPFHCADVPPELRVSVNVLEAIDPDSLTARADILAVCDGLVKRSNPKNAEFDDAAVKILAGVVAFVLLTAPKKRRNLSAMRAVLLQMDGLPTKEEPEPSGLYADALRMMALDGCGGLTRSAGLMIAQAIESSKGLEKEALATARRHSDWVDDPAFAAVLDRTTFDLTALRSGKATLYLVIPPEYLDTQGAFLRLFVRTALNVMMKGGNRKNAPCLFILDEFYSLGHMQIVATAAGQMRSYGVQLWPFLQDLGQLFHLYGPHESHTFFSNADAHIFFGNTDTLTLNAISAGLGLMTAKEAQGGQSGPRLSPQLVREIVSKRDGDNTARGMLVFGKGGDIFALNLAPWYKSPPKVTLNPWTIWLPAAAALAIFHAALQPSPVITLGVGLAGVVGLLKFQGWLRTQSG